MYEIYIYIYNLGICMFRINYSVQRDYKRQVCAVLIVQNWNENSKVISETIVWLYMLFLLLYMPYISWQKINFTLCM